MDCDGAKSVGTSTEVKSSFCVRRKAVFGGISDKEAREQSRDGMQ